MKLVDLYRNGKEELKNVEKINVSKKLSFKITLFTILFTIIIGLPFIIIFGSLITVFSPVRIMYWITMVLICIVLPIIMGLSAVFNIYLLKNYLEEVEQLQTINYKAIFVKELLNPISLLLAIIVCVVIGYMAM
jgi:hypothetical protein